MSLEGGLSQSSSDFFKMVWNTRLQDESSGVAGGEVGNHALYFINGKFVILDLIED